MRNKRLIIIFSCLIAVTLLVFLSSVIFSVRNINTRCLNHSYTDEEFDKKIIQAMGLEKGKSIFFLNEEKLISNIENSIPDVDVINIERKAPDRVTVHYVRLFDYYEVEAGEAFYSLTYDGRVIEEFDSPKETNQKIKIVYKSQDKLEKGTYIYDGVKKEIIKGVISALERIDLKNQKATERFDFIDIDTERDCIYIGVSGLNNLIKIEDASDLNVLFDKIRLGYSFVIDPKFDRLAGDKEPYKGLYRMAYVINEEMVMTPYSDYR